MDTPTSSEKIERQRAEAALRLSEATKSAVLATALDCIVTIDRNGIVQDFNPAAERAFGYTRAEAVGREMADLIIPSHLRERHRMGLARAVASGRDTILGRRIEITAIRRNGEEFPVELAITRIDLPETLLFTGHIRDITERKRAEAALSESQKLLASVTDNMADGVFRRMADGTLAFVNGAYLRMTGYDTLAELQCVPVEQFYTQPHRRGELLDCLEREGRFTGQEVEFARRDGTTFWGILSAIAVRDQAGGPILYTDGAVTDITSRKQAELRNASQLAVTLVLAQATTLAEAAPKILQAVCECLRWDVGVIWRVEESGSGLRCVDVWHGAASGWSEFITATQESVFPRGVGLPGLIWEAGEPRWIPDVVQDENFPRAALANQTGLHGAFGFPIRLGDQVLGVIEFFSREIRQPNHEVLDMFASIGSQIGQFIERKRAEDELRQLNRDLESRVASRTAELDATQAELRRALDQEKELNRLKSNFVSLVSHEFRTPLGVIMSAAEILEHYFDRLAPERRREHLQDVHRATRQIAGLMEEVLLLGRMESGRMHSKPVEVSLQDYCARVVDETRSATNHRCPIVFKARNITGTAVADAALLQHIFTNLLSNAVKYSAAGETVHLTAERAGREAVFQVRDQGVGIPEEDMKQLFTAFHRGGNVADRPGSGLGLVIVKRCVELHGGTVALESKVGEGTVVTVRLPLFEGHTPAQQEAPKTQRAGASGLKPRGRGRGPAGGKKKA